MVIALLTIVAGYLIEALLVGTLLAWVLHIRDQPKFGAVGIAGTVVLFAFLNAYYVPALAVFDATITIGHPGLAQLFEANGPVSVAQFLSFGWFDLLICVLQSIFALVVAQVIIGRARSAA